MKVEHRRILLNTLLWMSTLQISYKDVSLNLFLRFICTPPQVSFSALTGRCASLRLRCATGSRSVGTSLTSWTAENKPRAASIAVPTAVAASRRNSCAMGRETAWMARMRSAAVRLQVQFCGIYSPVIGWCSCLFPATHKSLQAVIFVCVCVDVKT